MKKFVIANWKANKNPREAEQWIDKFMTAYGSLKVKKNLEVIICPPFTDLYLFETIVKKVPLKVGIQDISPLTSGAYTGEIAVEMLPDFIDYVLVGHSERRRYFGENERILTQKLARVFQKGLQPVLCLQEEDKILQNVRIVAYEPSFAIGSGNPDTIDHVIKVCRIFKNMKKKLTFLYGGSVDTNNIENFATHPQIDGVLIGHSSLDADIFYQIISKVNSLIS